MSYFLLPFLVSEAIATSPGPAETGVVIAPQVVADLAHDSDAEYPIEAWTYLRAWARVPSQTGIWYFEARGLHRSQRTGGIFGDDPWESTWSTELGPTGWKGPLGNNWLEVGHLVERWGNMDVLGVVDIVNGRDLRSGPLTPPELMRIPTPMLNLDIPLWENSPAEVDLSLGFLPFGASDRVAFTGSDWALLQPGMVEGLLCEMEQWEGDALSEAFLRETIASLGGLYDEVTPQTGFVLGDLLAAQSQSPSFARNIDLTARMQARVGRTKLGVMAAWMRSRQAVPELDPSLSGLLSEERLPSLTEQQELIEGLGDGLSLVRPRTVFLGFEASSWIGPLSIRTEAGWRQIEIVPTDWLGSSETSLLSSALGVDYAYGSSFLVSLETAWRRMLDPPPNPWMRRADELQVALAARLSLWADRFEIQPVLIWDPMFRELMARPSLKWRPIDPIQFELALLSIEASTEAPRSFRDAMTTEVGPFGYVSDNDSVIFSISWIP